MVAAEGSMVAPVDCKQAEEEVSKVLGVDSVEACTLVIRVLSVVLSQV